MNPDQDEQAFVDFAKKHLDQSVDQLDPTTLARLGCMRQEAFSQDSQPIQWAWSVWGLATASVIVLSLALWVQNPMNARPSLITEDLELLASSDSLEFYEELEFYDWLEEHDQAT